MGSIIISGTPDPVQLERVAQELERIWPADLRAGSGKLGLAVSGGPDSLALLLLCAAAWPGDVAVASVDHGLRPEAESEVAFVHNVCAALNVPFTALSVKVAGGNLQARAREARYAALSRWVRDEGLGALATAHHADDQAETLFMRLARGSGLSGLAGVRAAQHFTPADGRPPFPLLRPLLSWRKADLEEVVAQAGLKPVDDPSNKETRFDRVRVRNHLAQHDWIDAQDLAKSAGHLAEAWRAIEWYAQIDWEEMVVREDRADGGLCFRYNANVPRIIQIETVRRIVEELGGIVTRSEAGRAADRLWRGENASLGGVLAVPTVEMIAKVGVEMRVWRFSPEPARRVH